MNVFGDTTLNTVSRWLDGLGRRQDAIAQNIANIDTPGYVRRDVPFEVELARQVSVAPTGRLAATHPAHLRHAAGIGGLASPATQLMASSRRDGNNVDIDQEMVDLAETQLRYQAAASALTTRLGSIRNVIQST